MKFSLGDEWNEVKRFEKLSDEERSIMFYSENKHDFIYYQSIIKQLTDYYDKKIYDETKIYKALCDGIILYLYNVRFLLSAFFRISS